MQLSQAQHDEATQSSRDPDALSARLLTWNINGLRKVAASHEGLKALLDQFEADIVEHDLARAQGYHCLFTHCKVPRKPSYAGVATFIRAASGLRTIASTTSLSDETFFGSPGTFLRDLNPDRLSALDSEGRVLVTDHGHFVLFNVYAPCISSSDEDEKTEERRQFKKDFLATLEARILELDDRGRAVVLVGDLNACASQMDHSFTMTDAEFYASNWSKWIRGLLALGSSEPPRLVDCFRRMHPDRKNAFTCWNTVTGARENNYGTRIDYIIAGAAFADRALRNSDINPDFAGSDHCPVRTTFSIAQSCASEEGQGYRVGSGVAAEHWPEHPPECSCFYGEFVARQEKLARYFSTSGPTPGLPAQSLEKDSNTKTDVGVDDGSAATKFDRRSDGLKSSPPSRRETARPAGLMNKSPGGVTQLRKSDTRGKLLSSRAVKGGAGGTSGGPRQSKLLFTTDGGDAKPARTGVAAIRRPLSRECDNISERSANSTYRVQVTGNGCSSPLQPSGATPSHGRSTTPAEHQCGTQSESGTSRGASAEAWKAIFSQKRSNPVCEHGEVSIQRTVLKAGPNYNRRFYTCARSAGNWPSDRNARCNFFQWRLDGVKGYKDRPPDKKSRRS